MFEPRTYLNADGLVIIDERLPEMTEEQVKVYVSHLLDDGILDFTHWVAFISGKYVWLELNQDSFTIRVEDHDPRVKIWPGT